VKYFAVMVEDEDAGILFDDVNSNWPTASIKPVVIDEIDGDTFETVEVLT
jgi:hypothetical protein